MTTRSSGSVTSTDVLIALLSHDLRGSWADAALVNRRRAPRPLVDAAAAAAAAAADAPADAPAAAAPPAADRGPTSRS
jgi:hypothetical protein